MDDAWYGAERVLVTTAMLVMCIAYVVNLLDERVEDQIRQWQALLAGSPVTGSVVPSLIGITALFAMSRAVAASSPALRHSPGLAWPLGALGTVAGLAFAWLLVTLPDAWMCSLLVLLIGGGGVLPAIADRPVPLDWTPERVTSMARLRLAGGLVGLGVLMAMATQVPNDNAWATRLALFLLLWAAFLGASMATYERRHLTIDAVRKAVPARFTSFFNGFSLMAAGVFTAGFLWLAIQYWLRRLDQATLPGEIPQWLSTLAIPVALTIMTLRFFGQAVTSFADAALTSSTSPAGANPPQG